MVKLRHRRRIARVLAAKHLLRHGSVIYGVHFGESIPVRATPRPLLVSNCFLASDDRESGKIEVVAARQADSESRDGA